MAAYTTAPRLNSLPRGGCLRAGIARPRSTLKAHRRCGSVSAALQLTPTGNGKMEHLDEEVAMPSAIKLPMGLVEVGRAPPADVVIAVPTVSTRHATMRVGASSVEITDLGSTNGTIIDGEELEPTRSVELKPGSEVVFGDKYLAKFRLDVIEDAVEDPAPGDGDAAPVATDLSDAVPAAPAAEEKSE